MKRFRFLPLLLLFLPAACALSAQENSAQPPAPAPSSEGKKPAEEPVPAPSEPVYPTVLFQPIFRAKLDPATFVDPARAAELFLAREKLIQDLLSERRRILTTDPKARELHTKILELNKQLAVVLESKRAVRELSRDLMLIDARINALARKPPEEPAAKKAGEEEKKQPVPTAGAKAEDKGAEKAPVPGPAPAETK